MSTRSAMRTAVTLLVALTMGAGPAGCGDDDEPAATTAPARQTSTVGVYLMQDEKVMPVARTTERTPAVGAAALRALLEGPTAAERKAGLTSAIPEGTELRGLDITRGVATVDLSRRFAAGGGSLSTLARVAQVVYTLTRFASVRRVAFRLDGEPARAIGGEGLIVDPPVDRADFEELTPQILVDSPLRDSAVSSPLRALGTSNNFEATFVVELLAADGKRLAKEVVTATSGSGRRGTFEASIPFDEAAAGAGVTLYAYEPSAQDGSPLHEVRIPLKVAR